MRRKNYKYLLCACIVVYVYYFFGVGDYIQAKTFEEFDYPLNVDIRPLVMEVVEGKMASVAPINYYPYRFLTNSGICKTIERLDLFIAVKSAISHFGHRDAIRRTYGQDNITPGRIIKTLFFVGIDESPLSETQIKLEEEMAAHKDIIQIDFHDNYYNNTIKTMMTFRWLYEHCSAADFYLFTDDDMYISVSNLLDYVADKSNEASPSTEANTDGHLFAGFMFNSTPQRFKNSKWRVSLEEYPWDRWPPYVTAGAYVLSNKTLKTMYIGSLYVKHFRFDDIYLGIVAKKLGIVPTHCSNFYFYKKPYSVAGYSDVIASHGYGNHAEFIKVWNQQNNVHH